MEQDYSESIKVITFCATRYSLGIIFDKAKCGCWECSTLAVQNAQFCVLKCLCSQTISCPHRRSHPGSADQVDSLLKKYNGIE